MATVVDELVTYYQELMIIQYVRKPKAQGTLHALIETLINGAIDLQVRDGFNLDTAIGKQLNTLGEYRGEDRVFFTLDLSKVFVAIPSYDDSDKGTVAGISDYDDPQPPSTFTMLYNDFIKFTLLDGDYRRVIKYLAKLHANNHALGSLDDIFFEFFGVNANIVDNEDMTITYQHLTSDPDVLYTIISQMKLLPKPAGVRISTEEVASF